MEVIRYALLGLGIGALYAMVAQGLVVIYRGSGIVNFAHGAFVMSGGYAYYAFCESGWSKWWAALAAVALSAALGAVVHLVILKPMSAASAISRVIATLGLLITLQSAVLLLFGTDARSAPSLLPRGSARVLGVSLGQDQLIILGVGAVLTVFLWAIFRWTAFGRLTSGVAENPRVVALMGHSPDVIATANWMVGSALAGLAGVLLAPVTFLLPTPMVMLVVPALAAALVGGFRSLPLAFVTALVIGAGQSVISRYVSMPGWSESAVFLLIIAVLVIQGRAIPLRSFVADRLPSVGSGRTNFAAVAIGGVVSVALMLTWLPLEWVTPVSVTVIWAIFCFSVLVVTGYGGQLSLAQYVIGGFSGLIAAQLSGHEASLPFWLAALIGVLGAIAVGLLMGIPSLRTRGITLAIVTLGLGNALYDLVLNNGKFGGGTNGLIVDAPTLFGWEIDPLLYPERYGALAIVALLVVAIAVTNLRRGASGRRLLAVRSNERAAAALGVNVYAAKIYAFTVGAGIAGVAGVLMAFLQPTVLPGQFDIFPSINIVAMTVVGGMGSAAGALAGALMLPAGVAAQIFHSLETINRWMPLIGGLVVLLVLRLEPSGMLEMNRKLAERLIHLVRRPHHALPTAPDKLADSLRSVGRPESLRSIPPQRVDPRPLRVTGLGVRFGNVVACDEVDLTVMPGEIHGLIGPNGAGKTTFIDAVTGFVKPSSGSVVLGDQEVSGWGATPRARKGLGRSFQSVELFSGLSVRENLAIAGDSSSWTRFLTDLVWPGKARLSTTAEQAIVQFQLTDALDVDAESLSFGRRRLVAIARAVASRPSVLLLDEPAAGLDDTESSELAGLITNLARDWGIGVMLVEHNLELVLSTCDRVTVLAGGRVLFTGTPDEVRSNPAVLAAYMGTEQVAEPQELSSADSTIR